MTLEVSLRRGALFWATFALTYCGSSVTLGEGVPAAGNNQRVNHVVGPDPVDPVDDDDPNNDPNHVKAQNETTIAIMRAPDGTPLNIFAAWNDYSWHDLQVPPGRSRLRTIGFGVSADIHGDWSVLHDLARSEDGYAAEGYLPPPPGGPERRWRLEQFDPVAAVIPPASGITGVRPGGQDGGITLLIWQGRAWP